MTNLSVPLHTPLHLLSPRARSRLNLHVPATPVRLERAEGRRTRDPTRRGPRARSELRAHFARPASLSTRRPGRRQSLRGTCVSTVSTRGTFDSSAGTPLAHSWVAAGPFSSGLRSCTGGVQGVPGDRSQGPGPPT